MTLTLIRWIIVVELLAISNMLVIAAMVVNGGYVDIRNEFMYWSVGQ